MDDDRDGSGTEYILVTEYFHPDTAATGQLLTDLAVGLHRRGLDINVYTGQPNYHSGTNDARPNRTEHRGVSVRRIRAPQIRQSSFLRRALNWFAFSAWMTLVLLVDRTDRDRELVFVSNPPVLPPLLWFVARIRGWSYTYIVHDLYPDFAVESGYFRSGGFVETCWAWATRRTLCDADGVVALGPMMRDRLLAHAPDADVTVIHNWQTGPDIEPLDKSENRFSSEHGLTDRFVVLYSGNIGANHDLETLIEAARELATDGDDATPAVKFLVIGEGDRRDAIVELAEEYGLRPDVVEFLPYQPVDRLPESLTCGDVSVVAVEEGMEGICVSSKLYTALAAGMPVLAIASPAADEARVIEAHDAGEQVEQGDAEPLADVVRRWAQNPERVERQGSNARAAYDDCYTRERALDRYYRVLAS